MTPPYPNKTIPQNIRVGEVVTVASGGPKMTVETVDASNEYCNLVWFDEHDQVHQAKIHRSVLRLSGDHTNPAGSPGIARPGETLTQQQIDEQGRRHAATDLEG